MGFCLFFGLLSARFYNLDDLDDNIPEDELDGNIPEDALGARKLHDDTPGGDKESLGDGQRGGGDGGDGG